MKLFSINTTNWRDMSYLCAPAASADSPVFVRSRQGAPRFPSWGRSPSCARAAAARPAWRSRMSRSEPTRTCTRTHTHPYLSPLPLSRLPIPPSISMLHSKLAVYRLCFHLLLIPLIHTLGTELLSWAQDKVANQSVCVCVVYRLCFTKGHFPKLAECAHFHYENVDFGTIQVKDREAFPSVTSPN